KRQRSSRGKNLARARRPDSLCFQRASPATTRRRPDCAPTAEAERSLRRDDALFEDEAAVEAPFPGGDNRESVLGALIEGEALDADQRHVLARRAIDGLL